MIEPPTSFDSEAILAITARIDIFSPQDKACVQELWDEWLRRGSASGYEFAVHRDEGQVQGYICYGPTPLTVGTWDIYWLAVSPEHRRKGIARALIGSAEEQIAREGGRLILIETSGIWDYQGTRRFYESCGYHYQAAIHDFYAPGDDLIVFGKTLRHTQ